MAVKWQVVILLLTFFVGKHIFFLQRIKKNRILELNQNFFPCFFELGEEQHQIYFMNGA